VEYSAAGIRSLGRTKTKNAPFGSPLGFQAERLVRLDREQVLKAYLPGPPQAAWPYAVRELLLRVRVPLATACNYA
jgi:hypothetical protein